MRHQRDSDENTAPSSAPKPLTSSGFSCLIYERTEKLSSVFSKIKGFLWGAPDADPSAPSVSTTGLSTEALMQQTMQQAMQLTEVYEDPMDKTVHASFAFVSYVLPIVVALFAGWWIGDGYAGMGSKQSLGDVYGVHVISLAGELILPIITVACARAAKKGASDGSMYKWLAIGTVLLLLVSAGSATAQWFLILNNIHSSGYNPSSIGIITMMVFRVCMPIA